MSDETYLDVAHIREKVRPTDAFFVKSAEARTTPLNNEKEVQIGWTLGTTDDYSQIESVLQEYTWATNDNPQRWVQDPIIAGSPLAGLWRQAYVTRIERRDSNGQPEFLVVLTLRLGWAEAIDWTEAILVNKKDADGNGESVPGVDDASSYNDASAVIVRFPNISPYKINEVLAELSDSEFTSPTVQSQQLTGVWHKAFAAGSKADDGSGIIDFILSRERFTVSLYRAYGTKVATESYRIYDVTRDIAQTIVDDWKATGRSAEFTTSGDSKLCTISLYDTEDADDSIVFISARSCAFFVREHFYTGQESPVGVPANEMGITYASNFSIDRQTGLYSGSVTKRVRQTQKVPSYRSDNTHANYTEVERWEGTYLVGTDYKEATLTIVDDDIVVTLSAAITLPVNAIDPGHTWRVEKRVNDDCTYDLVVSERTEKEISDIQYDTADSNVASSSAVEQLNETTASVTLIAGTNETLRADVRYNKETGLYDIVNSTTESKPTKGQDIEVTAAATRTVSRSIQTATKPLDPVQEDGKIKTTQWEETEFADRYRVTESVVEAKDQTTTHTSTSRADQTAERVIDSNAEAKQDATAVEGKIVNASSRENEFGKFDNTLETITPENQTTTHTSTSRADQTAERVIDSNAAAKQDATAVAGKIVNASSKENEFGKFDNTLETITPEYQESTDDAKDLYVNQSTEKHTQGEDPVIVPFTAGTIKRVASSPTEFGKKRTAEETRTAQAVSDASKVTTVDYFTAQETSGDRNQTDFEPDVLALEGTTIKISKWSRNEFDRYDNEETTLTPTARDSGWIPYIDANGTSYKREFRNQVVPLVDGYTDDTNNSLSFSMNKHSLYDGSGSRTAKSEEDYGTIWRNTRTDVRTEKRYRRIEDVNAILGKIMKDQYTTDTKTHKSVITSNYGQADITFSNYFEELEGSKLDKDPTLRQGRTHDGYSYYRVDAYYTTLGDVWIDL